MLPENIDQARKPRWWLLAASLAAAVAWRGLAGFQAMAARVGECGHGHGDHPLPLFFAHVAEGILLGVACGTLLAYLFSTQPRGFATTKG